MYVRVHVGRTGCELVNGQVDGRAAFADDVARPHGQIA
jgi:hypothetical protein